MDLAQYLSISEKIETGEDKSLDRYKCNRQHVNMRMGSEHVGFLGELDLSCFLSLGHHMLVLNSHNTTSPGSSEGDVLVEVGGEVALEVGEVSEVFLSDIGEGNAGGGLGVAELSESCLTSDEAEWDVVLSAESW